MIVYRFTNKINKKIYIGITKDLNQRIEQHMHAESPLGEDIRKYGIDNFHIEILSACSTIGKAKELEKTWIEQLDCREPKG